ncbi:MAG TPA: hypothetical protein VGK80_05545 [Rhodanobacteraceae bacterium]
MNLPVRIAAMALLFALAAGCSQAPAPPQNEATNQQGNRAEQAAEKLKLYRQMLDSHRGDLAAPIGEEIVNDFGDTPAAAEVRKTLPQIEAKAKAQAEQDRLAALWSYQTGMQSGGRQVSASIGSSRPTGEAAVRLILRRHSKWGQSVYLFGSGRGFVCKGQCDVPMRFDGKPRKWKAYLPKTGEPALFIKDDARFIKALIKAKVIEMDVVTAGHGKETLSFEVGGYDPAKFPESGTGKPHH